MGIRRGEARHSQKTLTPIRPSTISPEDHGGSFAAAVLKSGAKRLTAEKDSQKALLAYHEKTEQTAKTKENFIFRAYLETQPERILDYSVEQSEGDKRMSELMAGDFCRKCGMKVCRCVDYSKWGNAVDSKPGALPKK